jgi:hypothetical protein
VLINISCCSLYVFAGVLKGRGFRLLPSRLEVLLFSLMMQLSHHLRPVINASQIYDQWQKCTGQRRQLAEESQEFSLEVVQYKKGDKSGCRDAECAVWLICCRVATSNPQTVRCDLRMLGRDTLRGYDRATLLLCMHPAGSKSAVDVAVKIFRSSFSRLCLPLRTITMQADWFCGVAEAPIHPWAA